MSFYKHFPYISVLLMIEHVRDRTSAAGSPHKEYRTMKLQIHFGSQFPKNRVRAFWKWNFSFLKRIYRIHKQVLLHFNYKGIHIYKYLVHRTRYNLEMKIYFHSTYSPLKVIHQLQQCCNFCESVRKTFSAALQINSPQFLVSILCLQKVYTLSHFF